MLKYVLLLLIALVFEAVGVVYLSRGLKQINAPAVASLPDVWRVIVTGATNRDVLLGVLLEAAFFGALLFLLSRRDVSFIWPLTSLGLVLTTLAAQLVLREDVSGVRWFGVTLIVAGSMLIVWSEKRKEPPAEPNKEVAQTAATATPEVSAERGEGSPKAGQAG